MPDASATATAPAQTIAPATGGRGLLTASLMAATFMQALDTTIANVALPHMEGSLSATQDQITWVLTSYIVAAAIMTPLSGWLAGRFGRKQIILLSIAGFVVSSALCGVATSLPLMVIYRLLQGLSGAALVPISQAVLLDIYPTHKHGQAMAMWGLGVTFAPVIGPVLGGWLTDNYSWRWVFYINVPIGILAFFGLLAAVKDSPACKAQFRFLRLRRLVARRRRVADDARPRRAQGLVRLAGNRDRSDPGSARLLFFHRAHGDGGASVPPCRVVQGPQLRHRQRFYFHRRHHPVRDPGADPARCSSS